MVQNSEKRILRKFFYVVFAILFLIICIGGCIFIWNSLSSNGKAVVDINKQKIAVITKSTTSQFWKSVFSGANAASTEYNLGITFEGPDNEEDYEKQNELINKAVKNGVDAIVFSAVDYNASAEAINYAVSQGLKVVVIDSDVNSDRVSCRISTDNYLAGKKAGDKVLESTEKAIYVGIVNFDKNSANGQEREQGFRDAVEEDSRVTIIDSRNVLSTSEDAKNETEWMVRQHPQINVIVTFNEWTSLGVGYAIEEENLADETMVIAFDSNIVSVEMLEKGVVDALLVQNPYAMGYLGVECAYKLINNQSPKQTRIDTSTQLITRDNMFDEECQRILFPFD